MKPLRNPLRFALFLAAATLTVSAARAAEDSTPRYGPSPQALQQTIDAGVDFLVRGQARDGSFSPQAGTGVTALVASALLKSGRTPSDPAVAKSLKWLEGFVQPDGGIYPPKALFGNYETCVAIVCFTEANRDHRYDRLLKRAEAYVKGIQWDEGEGKQPADLFYGGAGYGKSKRPDLSNTSFLIDALKTAGAGPNDEAVRKALVFVSRCQNFESSENTAPFAVKNPDCGFYYTCAAGGSSPAGTLPNGGLRSYGSMTYSGFKSLLYAGVAKDDPRVKAALQWIRKNYDVKSNPGMGSAGLYYYYHVFAKAMDAAGEDLFEDAQGVKHDWRRELAEELARRQKPDGSWINDADRWMEGDPNLVTSFALLALSHCRK